MKIVDNALIMVDDTDFDGNTFVIPEGVTIIKDYAFLNRKNLRTVIYPKSLRQIEKNAFLGCTNLDTGAIFGIWSFDIKNFTEMFPHLKRLDILYSGYEELRFNIYNSYFCDGLSAEDVYIDEGFTSIGNGNKDFSLLFANARRVYLPSTLKEIRTETFIRAKKLESIFIPKNVTYIGRDSFYPNIILNFEGIGSMKASELDYLSGNNFCGTRTFYLKDGTYIVGKNDFGYIKLDKNDFSNLSDKPNRLISRIDFVFNYLKGFISVNKTHHNELIKYIKNEDLIKTLESDLEPIPMIYEILKLDLKDEFLFSDGIVGNFSESELLLFITKMNDSLKDFVMNDDCFDLEKFSFDGLSQFFPKIVDFCDLWEKYRMRDKYLFNYKAIRYLTLEEIEKIVSHYNANMKRLLKEIGSFGTNQITMFEILGVFSDDEVFSQKMMTFIIEKLLIPAKNDELAISDYFVARLFGDVEVVRDIDLEFIKFFVKNYKELLKIESDHNGFVSSVYNQFRDISFCSSSNKGDQRHLQVTVDKCIDYLGIGAELAEKQEDRDLQILLNKHYGQQRGLHWDATEILKEAKKAPRNIFCESCDSGFDLGGLLGNGFSYEWLPKWHLDNFVLGKYCNNCAHIQGEGNGIMKYSMISDNAQNLVIRNEEGRIIAKATLAVDRDCGYGIFNTVGISTDYRNDNSLEKIYEAFIEGTNSFIEAYNSNYPDKQISVINIGTNRNELLSCLDRHKHEETTPLPIINFGDYGFVYGHLNHHDELIGNYRGDAEKQRRVYVKEKMSA